LHGFRGEGRGFFSNQDRHGSGLDLLIRELDLGREMGSVKPRT